MAVILEKNKNYSLWNFVLSSRTFVSHLVKNCYTKKHEEDTKIHEGYKTYLLIPFFKSVTLKFISRPVLIPENLI